MRAVVQRVSTASVTVDGEVVSSIGPGLLVLAAVGKGDNQQQVDYLANKLCELRIFEDASGKMNLNVRQVEGAILLVSQFTLFGDARKGNRPSFDSAELPDPARLLFNSLAAAIDKIGVPVSTGKFRAHMQVHLINDGPITILIDSSRMF